MPTRRTQPNDTPKTPPQGESQLQRSGRIALIGRPNVGKSTLLNAALGYPLAIVTQTPQTTRDAILGVVHHGHAEIALLDTPGLHHARTRLGHAMNQIAHETAQSADVLVFVTEMPVKRSFTQKQEQAPEQIQPHPADIELLAALNPGVPTILVVNKIDKVRDKRRILPLLDAMAKLRSFSAIVPISALRRDGVSRVLDEIATLCPEAAWSFDTDTMTDKPSRFFAAEYVREQILLATEAEVPHAAAVQIDRYIEQLEGDIVHVDASILIEKSGQKKILIGSGAEKLKQIGTRARLRIEDLIGRRVNLKLWVKVTPKWRDSTKHLEALGYRNHTS